MGKPSDRDRQYMYDMWGTTSLITDYSKNLIREVVSEKYLKTKETQEELYDEIPNSSEIITE